MKSNAFYAVLGLGVLVMVLIAWFGWRYHEEHAKPTVATSTPAVSSDNLQGQAIYTNGAYGFSFVYPETAKLDEGFRSYYHLPNYWRANALPNATGTPVIAVIGYRTDSDHSYPRYFDAEVRVGVSKDSRELAQCLKATVDQGETALPDVTINGTVWKAFSFQSAGMMQYEKGISYRTIHEGQCFALEQLQTGSNYRDDAPSFADISDDVLQQKYNALDAVVKSFTFARP